MKRMICGFLLALLGLFAFVFAASAEEIVESGECGKWLSYTLTQDGVLTISGRGEMEDHDPLQSGADPYFGAESQTPVTKIVLEQGVTGIGSYAFENTAATEVVLPSSLGSIGEGAFRQCASLTEIAIPSGVTVLPASVFADCESLVSVSLPEGLREIGAYAFCECTSLSEITLPDVLISIGEGVFRHCKKLARIDLPAGITEIPYDAFGGCYKLAAVTFPEDLTSIGAYAFSNCSSFTSLALPSPVKEIGAYAFSSCARLKTVSLPDSLRVIGEYAFHYCKALTSMVIPSGLETIGSSLFRNCTALVSVTLEPGSRKVGAGMFFGCSALVDVTLPEGLTEIGGGAFCFCTSLAHLTIPQSVKKIDDGAFSNCTVLEELTLPDGLQKVTPYLFEYCKKLTTITIPKGVTAIEDTAFYDCYSLETVYYMGGREDWKRVAKGSFTSTSYRVMLYEAIEEAFRCLYHGAPGPVLKEDYRAPTCTDYGGYYEVQRCTVCGGAVKSTYKPISSLGHLWGPVERLNGAYHRYVCKRDPAHVREEAHTWDYTNVLSVRASAAGCVCTYACTKCGEKTERTEAHQWDYTKVLSVRASAAGCVCTYACTKCGEETERTEAHQWDLGKITAVPTSAAKGTVTFTCTACGGKKARAIPYVAKKSASPGAKAQIDVLLAYMTLIQQEKPQAYLYFDLDNDGVYEILIRGGASAYTVYTFKNAALLPIGELPADARFYALKGSDLLFFLNDAGSVCTVRCKNGALKTETLLGGAHWAETQGSPADLTKTYASDKITLPKLTNLQKAYVKTVKEAFAAAKLKEYTGYLFFDMDRDGYYEVIEAQVLATRTETESVFSMQYTFWTCRDGNMTKVGSFRTGSFQAEYGRPEFQPPENGNGVVLLTWIDTQRYRTDLIYIENGKLKQKQLSSGADSDSYFYGSDNTIPAYPMHIVTFPADADLLKETEVRTGDVNGDGKVGTDDARLALRAAVGLEKYAASSAEFLAADADHNGKITTGDARMILRCAVGLETPTE